MDLSDFLLCGTIYKIAPAGKKGKKRMKQIGSVEVPQKAFLEILKLD